MRNLREQTLRAGIIKIYAQGMNFVLRIGSLMVLARLLDPEDFGLVGMVTVVTGVLSLFKDAGLTMVTVQRQAISNEEVSMLFWLNILGGVILGLLTFALAPILAEFYQEPALFGVTAVLGASFIFYAAGAQHSALLQREMRFGTLSMIELLSLVVGILVGVGMAMNEYGYWALVAMMIVQPAVSTAILWFTSSWIPMIPRRRIKISSMVRFGFLATLNSLIMYIAYNLEKLLLGRFWGAEALGIYGRAYQLVSIPTENLNSATGGVLFAVLSRLQNEPERLKKYFLNIYAVMSSLTLPSTVACALFADDIILLLLGHKWKDVVPIFRLLAPTIMVLGLINPMYWLVVSIGLAGRSLKIALVLAPLVVTSYIVGLPYGPSGVAFAYSVVMTLWLIPCLVWCTRGTIISLGDLLSAITKPLVSSLVAGGIAYVVYAVYVEAFSPLIRLVASCSSFLIVYLWMLLIIMRQKEKYLEVLQGISLWPSFNNAK